MQPDDFAFALQCVRHENWLSETREVFEAFYGHDPRGCFIAEENHQRVGMCIATAYGTAGFLGELIVVPERRGCGLGRQLMEHALDYLHRRGCRSIYLDGDRLAVPLYERLGFRTVCTSLRFVGTVSGQPSESVREMKLSDLAAVTWIDQAAFGADRSFFLKYRFERFPRLCQTLVCDNGIAGFIMGQPGHGVVTVGPWLVSDGSERTADLLIGLARESGALKLRIGVLETNPEAVALLRSLGSFEQTEPARRMVLGPDGNLGASAGLLAIGSAAKG